MLVPAVAIGYLSPWLSGVAVGLICLLPFFSHLHWVGYRRAFAEPSAVTVVLVFYVFVFPLRGLSLVLGHFAYTEPILRGVSTRDVVTTLILASVATSLFVEAYHYFRHARLDAAPLRTTPRSESGSMVLLGAVFCVIVFGSLLLMIKQSGGIAGVKATYLSHSKTLALESKSIATSLWTLSVPAAWCAAYIMFDRHVLPILRLAALGILFLLLAATLVLFGGRLNALLMLIGVWTIFHHTVRPLSPGAITVSIILVIALSIPVLQQRAGGNPFSTTSFGIPTYQRISQLTGYGVLDASIAVHQEPQQLRSAMLAPKRLSVGVAYIVPSWLWPNKPEFEDYRLDTLIARDFGTQYQQDTGYPSSYITEMRLYGGITAVLLASILFGILTAMLERFAVRQWHGGSPGALLWLCFVVTAAFSYWKDGDVLMTVVGFTKISLYLVAAMLAAGVRVTGGLAGTRRHRGASLVRPLQPATGHMRPVDG